MSDSTHKDAHRPLPVPLVSSSTWVLLQLPRMGSLASSLWLGVPEEAYWNVKRCIVPLHSLHIADWPCRRSWAGATAPAMRCRHTSWTGQAAPRRPAAATASRRMLQLARLWAHATRKRAAMAPWARAKCCCRCHLLACCMLCPGLLCRTSRASTLQC